MPLEGLLKRLGCLSEREDPLGDWPELTCIDQVPEVDELFSIGLDDKEERTHAKGGSLLLGWGAKHPQEQSALLDDAPGASDCLPASGIKHQINITHHLLETRGGIINELIGSQRAEECMIACRGGRDYRGTGPFAS